MIPGSGPIGVMRDGRLALNLRDHRGLVAGDVHVGEDRAGEKLFRTLYWYPDGCMTPARETGYDLVERIAAVPIATVRVARTTADAITAAARVDLFGFEQDRKIDNYLDDKEWF